MQQQCNETLEELLVTRGHEAVIVWSLTFHDLACIIAAGSTLLAVVITLYHIWTHALNYSHPLEQRFIIRILFLVPIYAVSSFLQVQWVHYGTYFKIVSDCYEAFAIASFFALLCSYVAPDLHGQKAWFREMRPVKPWAFPISLFAKCCCGQRGPCRTPSGFGWFNVIWTGIYNYCFIRVVMTISAVVAHFFHRFCEVSLSAAFAHLWYLIINGLAANVAIFCLAQFCVQLSKTLKEHNIFIKTVAIKLVVFLPFFQFLAISIATSTFLHPTRVIDFPDLKIGIPALLQCVEMACFSVLNLWAFPYTPYVAEAPETLYPSPDPNRSFPERVNERQPPKGGFLGLRAIWDAVNVWDVVKDFGRGARLMFCGARHERRKARLESVNYDSIDLTTLPGSKGRAAEHETLPRGPQGAALKHQGSASDMGRLVDDAQANPQTNLYRGFPSPPGRRPSTVDEHFIKQS
ncbi:hypothetical protein CDD83_6689 [Cordyceps sp. RAO-2017]|nr:hypothetical protein CDD83_6689 [Cordyceps sp. RAO-2017]